MKRIIHQTLCYINPRRPTTGDQTNSSSAPIQTKPQSLAFHRNGDLFLSSSNAGDIPCTHVVVPWSESHSGPNRGSLNHPLSCSERHPATHLSSNKEIRKRDNELLTGDRRPGLFVDTKATQQLTRGDSRQVGSGKKKEEFRQPSLRSASPPET